MKMATPEKITALADFVDRLEDLLYGTHGALPEHEQETAFDHLWQVLRMARARLVTYLAYTDDMLVGTEYCDECGDVRSVVTGIEREPDLMIITSENGFYPEDVGVGGYFRLPGSDAYGEHALVELARQRVVNAAVA
jgi:hypothetical protein